MTATVEAIYEEDSVLRLLAPVPFQIGAHVQVTLDPTPGSEPTQNGASKATTAEEDRQRLLQEITATAPDPQKAAALAREIAAMPIEAGGEEFSAEDHDKILYGGERGAW